MKITEDTVLAVAKLARLTITDDQRKQFAKQLSSILTYAEQLNKVNTNNVEPTSHVLPLSNVFREDQARASLSVDAVVANAPEKEGHFFKVPKIIE
jgi:aspartyl-tRNA(Asn)/glutamyl-tRNA(Gln) amidotransferase subunit C